MAFDFNAHHFKISTSNHIGSEKLFRSYNTYKLSSLSLLLTPFFIHLMRIPSLQLICPPLHVIRCSLLKPGAGKATVRSLYGGSQATGLFFPLSINHGLRVAPDKILAVISDQASA